MTKETFQRYALVTIVVLLAAIASQQVMAYTRSAIHHDHEMIIRHVDVEFFADEQRLLADEARLLGDEARLLGEEARQMAEHFHIRDGVCDLSEEARSFSNEVRHLRDQIRVEIR